jgi:hypothetical protein
MGSAINMKSKYLIVFSGIFLSSFWIGCSSTESSIPQTFPKDQNSPSPVFPTNSDEVTARGYASSQSGKDVPKSILACEDARRRAISEYSMRFNQTSSKEADLLIKNGQIEISTKKKELIGDGICDITLQFKFNPKDIGNP